jgi:tRNA pseudouridine38-40 synthase
MTELHSDVVRVRLDLSYDGTEFNGWAIQPDLRTVQGDLEAALARVVRLPGKGEPMALRTTVAGRTDAGVHARGQVAHVDIPAAAWNRLPGRTVHTPEEALRDRLTGVLADDVAIREVSITPPGFDARFSALGRRYAYRVADAQVDRDPLRRRHVLWHEGELDPEVLSAASATLTGLRDFAAFCKAREGATTVRELVEFSWRRATEGADAGLLVATVRADAFCHSMVRSLVGAVLAVGDGRRDRGWLATVAAGSTRAPSVTVAPPHGLTLEEVSYPPAAQVAARAELTRAKRSNELTDTPERG